MKTGTAVAVLLASSILAGNPSANAAQQPAAGSYAANVYVASATGGTCPDAAGNDYLGAVVYGGLDAVKVTVRFAFGGASPLLSRQVLTITDGVGTTRPSGTFAARLSSGYGTSGTFNANLHLFDHNSFVATIVENAPMLGCTEQFDISLIRIAPKL